MNTKYKIGKVGLILNGEQKNWYIKVEDNLCETGGYYIYYSANKDFKGEGFDDWVEGKKEYLNEYFKDIDFDIDWHIN